MGFGPPPGTNQGPPNHNYVWDGSGWVRMLQPGAGSGVVTVADGADVTEGTTTDAAVLDANGTVNAHIRGVAKVVADVWDSVNHWFKVSIQNTTLAVGADTSTMYSGATALTPKFAAVVASSTGATELVALVGGKKIRVLSMVLVANAAVNVKLQSHTTGDLTGLLYLAANGGFAAPYAPTGHFETVAGEALDINLSGNVAVGGWLTYLEVS